VAALAAVDWSRLRALLCRAAGLPFAWMVGQGGGRRAGAASGLASQRVDVEFSAVVPQGPASSVGWWLCCEEEGGTERLQGRRRSAEAGDLAGLGSSF